MSGEAHLHREVVESSSVGSLSLPTDLLCVFFLGGVQLILNRGSTKLTLRSQADLVSLLHYYAFSRHYEPVYSRFRRRKTSRYADY